MLGGAGVGPPWRRPRSWWHLARLGNGPLLGHSLAEAGLRIGVAPVAEHAVAERLHLPFADDGGLLELVGAAD
eukprot:10432343-Alexandrium_andersonii.AAC.1